MLSNQVKRPDELGEVNIESLEKLAAIIVAVGLVAGNLFMFSPLRTDNRHLPDSLGNNKLPPSGN